MSFRKFINKHLLRAAAKIATEQLAGYVAAKKAEKDKLEKQPQTKVAKVEIKPKKKINEVERALSYINDNGEIFEVWINRNFIKIRDCISNDTTVKKPAPKTIQELLNHSTARIFLLNLFHSLKEFDYEK